MKISSSWSPFGVKIMLWSIFEKGKRIRLNIKHTMHYIDIYSLRFNQVILFHLLKRKELKLE